MLFLCATTTAPWSARIPFLNDNELRMLSKSVTSKINVEPDSYGRSILHVASERNCALVKALLYKKVGGDVNGKDIEGNTPLMFAARSANIEIIRALVDKGASVSQVNNKDENPLHFFVKNNACSTEQCAEIFGYFAEFGLTVYSYDKNGDTPAHFAVEYSNDVALEYMVNKQYFQLETANKYVPSDTN